jgi:hypothetical protein
VDRVFEGKGVTGAVVCLGGKTKDVGKTMLTDGTARVMEHDGRALWIEHAQRFGRGRSGCGARAQRRS